MLKKQKPYLQNFALLLVVLTLVVTFGVKVVRVSGQSMLPTLQDGQWLLIQTYPAWLECFGHSIFERGDIITFKTPREEVKPQKFIKRIVAVPGDSVTVKEGILFLNSEAVQESYITRDLNPYLDSFSEVLVENGEIIALEGYALSELPNYLEATLRMLEPLPEPILKQSYAETLSYVAGVKLEPGYYFVLGDNRAFNASEDSTVFGPVAARAITGLYTSPRTNQHQRKLKTVTQQGRVL